MKRIVIYLFILITLQACHNQLKPDAEQYKLQKLENKDELVKYLENMDLLYEKVYGIQKDCRYWDYLSETNSEDECVVESGKIVVTGSRITAADIASITNNQVAGVDEGDIVKTHENYLIILRNGKLYSIDIGEKAGDFLVPIDQIDAFHPDWKHDVWLDELLIDDGLIIITGFNYDEDVTEIIRLRIDDQGQFEYLDTHLIRSEDYFHDSNYASRLVKHQLVTYFPGELLYSKDFEVQFPQIAKLPQKFRGEYKNLNWRDLIGYDDLYLPIQTLLNPYLHTFLRCDLGHPELICDSVGIITNGNVERYITSDFIYMTTSAWSERVLLDPNFSIYSDSVEENQQFKEGYQGKLFRINIEELSVGETNIDVVPINQFSFHQYKNDLYLLGEGENLELVKVPSKYFDSRLETHAIPIMETEKHSSWLFKNRFIGGDLVLVHAEIDENQESLIEFIDIKSGSKQQNTLDYTVERVEVVGNNVFTSGYKSKEDNDDYEGIYVNLLNPKFASILSENYIAGIVEGESRSHAFNSRLIDNKRIIGLTSKTAINEFYNNSYYYDEPSEITFIGGYPHDLNLLGHVKRQIIDDELSCEVSCDDWYGNTRPFFIGDRIFALSGFELIEVSIEGKKLNELERIQYNQF